MMKPGDLLFWRDEKFGRHRFWEIIGVHLGAVGQESVIEIRSLNEKQATAHGIDVASTYVPEPLLRNAAIYSRLAA